MTSVPAPANANQNRATAYRPDIDGLRGLAVLLVVAYHAFPAAVPGGFIGVDVFFVISGFLITGILLQGFTSPGFGFADFYARRARRIFPALILVLATSLGLGFFFLAPHEYATLGKQAASGAGFVANYVLWNESGYFDTGVETKPLMHLWSLGIEEQFYLLWPPLLYVVSRRPSQLFPVITAVAALSLLYSLFLVQSDQIADFYSPRARFWELALGGMLSVRRFDAARWREFLTPLGLALILVAAFAFDAQAPYPGWRALLPACGAALMIADADSFLNRKFLSHAAPVAIGLISYPLYLWHWPLLSSLYIYDGANPSTTLRFAAIAASLLMATATYRLIEKPIRFGPHRGVKTAILCLLMLATGLAGYYAYAHPRAERLTHDLSTQLDWKYWSDAACVKKYGVTPCETNSDTPQLLILGDSHANQLYPGFALTDPKIPVLSAGTCLPFDGLYLHVRKNQQNTPCDHENAFVDIKPVLEHGSSITTVLISFRWRHILTGEIKNPHERELWDSVTLFSTAATDKNQSANAMLANGMIRTVTWLKAHHLKVALMRATPELDPDLEPYCRLMTRAAPSGCDFDATEYFAERKLEDNLLARLREQFPDLPVYDPSHALCGDDRCTLMQNGTLLYRDNHHLSLNGSEFLARDIKNWMTRNGLSLTVLPSTH